MKRFLLRQNKTPAQFICCAFESASVPAEIKEQSHLLQGFYHIPNQSSTVLIIANAER
jgi:hypothetical protein